MNITDLTMYREPVLYLESQGNISGTIEFREPRFYLKK